MAKTKEDLFYEVFKNEDIRKRIFHYKRRRIFSDEMAKFQDFLLQQIRAHSSSHSVD